MLSPSQGLERDSVEARFIAPNGDGAKVAARRAPRGQEAAGKGWKYLIDFRGVMSGF